MSTLVKLDDLSLSLIIAKLSIEDLWTSGRVCARLNVARRTGAAVRRELALMIGQDAKRYEEKSSLNAPKRSELVDENGHLMFAQSGQPIQLQIYSFPRDFVRLLLSNFVNLTELTIATGAYSNVFASIIHLLEQFNQPNGSTLQSLKLYSQTDNRSTELKDRKSVTIPNVRTYHRLLLAVGSIGSLRKFTLDVNVKFCKKAQHPQIDLPILAQLEVFEFNSADYDSVCLRDSITRYAVANEALKSIAIHNQTHDMAWLLALPTQLSSRFAHLHLFSNFFNPRITDDYAQLCRHFAQLTSLEITYYQGRFTIFTLFEPLTHLTNLLFLVINFVSPFAVNTSTVPRNERGIMHFEVPSVKVLTINIAPGYLTLPVSHRFFHRCNLNRIFANVQVVQVTRHPALCVDCNGRVDGLTRTEVIALEEHCARHLFRHFGHCQHLRMVRSRVVDSDVGGIRHRQWAWNEMDPFEDEQEVETDQEDDED